MNCQTERLPLQQIELPPSMLPVAQATTEGPATSMVSDRLYQLAALTAGAFLLATLL
jgi:hypothetical protein